MNYLSFSGCYRRKIDLRNEDESTAVGWLEDDFHHFGVTIRHDGRVVTAVHAAALRVPWTTCSGALEAIQELVGKPLIARASDIGGLVEMRMQCTHLFDLSGLVLAQAVRSSSSRHYEVEMPDRPVTRWDSAGLLALAFGPGRVVLRRDGEDVMDWQLDGEGIVGPSAYAGRSLQEGFRAWTEAMPLDQAEYATILRRAVMVGSGRLVSMDGIDSATQMNRVGVCFTFQPGRRDQARFIHASRLDFTNRKALMLAEVNSIP